MFGTDVTYNLRRASTTRTTSIVGKMRPSQEPAALTKGNDEVIYLGVSDMLTRDAPKSGKTAKQEARATCTFAIRRPLCLQSGMYGALGRLPVRKDSDVIVYVCTKVVHNVFHTRNCIREVKELR